MSEHDSDGPPVDPNARADGLFAAIRSGVSADASPEARAGAAAAGHALLGLLEGAGARGGAAPAAHGQRAIPREQIIGLLAGLVRSIVGARTPTYLTKPEPPVTKSRSSK